MSSAFAEAGATIGLVMDRAPAKVTIPKCLYDADEISCKQSGASSAFIDDTLWVASTPGGALGALVGGYLGSQAVAAKSFLAIYKRIAARRDARSWAHEAEPLDVEAELRDLFAGVGEGRFLIPNSEENSIDLYVVGAAHSDALYDAVAAAEEKVAQRPGLEHVNVKVRAHQGRPPSEVVPSAAKRIDDR